MYPLSFHFFMDIDWHLAGFAENDDIMNIFLYTNYGLFIDQIIIV